jgi:PPOX class probable F420-dependent enzyme
VQALDPELRRRVLGASVARLATVRPDGNPHVVPITFLLHDDTVVSAVDHKPKTTTRLQRLRNIDIEPRVSVLVDHYGDDWADLWWVRADGVARVLEGGADHDEAIDRLVEKYRQYRDTRPQGPVIAVTVGRWAWWTGRPG